MERDLVFRSLYLFENSDTTLRMIAARAGVTKSQLIRGMVEVALDELDSHTATTASTAFIAKLTCYINKGAINEDGKIKNIG